MYFLEKTIRCKMFFTMEMKISQLITNISGFNYFEAGEEEQGQKPSSKSCIMKML